jgi:hypothetical protein
MQYKQAVKTGTTLMKRISADGAKITELNKRTEADKWELARLTAEMIGQRDDQDRKISQTSWGRAIGMSPSTAHTYREIGLRYALIAVDKLPAFSQAYEEVNRPDRAAGREAGLSRAHAESLTTVRNLPESAKAELVKELVDSAEPGSEVLAAANRAVYEQDVQRQRRIDERKAADPIGTGLAHNKIVASLNVALNKFGGDVKDLLAQLTVPIGPSLQEGLLLRVEDAETQLAEVRYLAEHGMTKINAEHQALLEGR